MQFALKTAVWDQISQDVLISLGCYSQISLNISRHQVKGARIVQAALVTSDTAKRPPPITTPSYTTVVPREIKIRDKASQ
jgi:hypothetical protein